MEIRFTARTEPDISDWGNVSDDAFAAGAYQVMQSEGGRFLNIWRSEAPKKTGRYAAGLQVQPFQRGATVGFEGRSTHPLTDWIQDGTRPHVIRAKGNGFLAFYWPNGPRGAGMYFFRSVNHPGTRPNPFTMRAIQRWLPAAGQAFRAAGLRFTMQHFGKKTTGYSA